MDFNEYDPTHYMAKIAADLVDLTDDLDQIDIDSLNTVGVDESLLEQVETDALIALETALDAVGITGVSVTGESRTERVLTALNLTFLAASTCDFPLDRAEGLSEAINVLLEAVARASDWLEDFFAPAA